MNVKNYTSHIEGGGSPKRRRSWKAVTLTAVVIVFAASVGLWAFNLSAKGTLMTLAVRTGLAAPTTPVMVELPGGRFTMGSEGGEKDERPAHEVDVPPFAIGKYEVSFAEWDMCVADGGCNAYKPADEGWGRSAKPVINVSWNDAKAYLRWLSDVTGEAFRLPTEAEWEYAARAETSTGFFWGEGADPSQANYDFSIGMTTAVDAYQPNQFGLLGVHGNVWEWIEDCWTESYEDQPPEDCDVRGLRGGSWDDGAQGMRSANRQGAGRDLRSKAGGFRVARNAS